MKTSRLAARLLAATNDKAIESLDKQLESVQKQAEVVDPDDKARKLDLQSQKVELEKRKLKLQLPKEKAKAMQRVVARLKVTADSSDIRRNKFYLVDVSIKGRKDTLVAGPFSSPHEATLYTKARGIADSVRGAIAFIVMKGDDCIAAALRWASPSRGMS